MQQLRKVGILGATGMVGQRFIQLLENHPWFEIAWLAASDRSSGKLYGDAAKWKLDTPLPERIARMVVSPAVPDGAPKIIFAALDADIAREMEPAFAAAGCAVVSNSSAFRMHTDVPLVIPEVNADHLPLVEEQSWRKESGGYIVKNEEEKLQEETLTLLGKWNGHAVDPLNAKLSAHCNRVPVEDGHMESVSIKLRTKASREDLIEAWREFTPLSGQGLPSAPAQPVEFVTADDRPQPRLDRMRGNGMASTVGRLRPCSLFDWKFTVLSHNTIRGAAGAAILNAEILEKLGKLEPSTPLEAAALA